MHIQAALTVSTAALSAAASNFMVRPGTTGCVVTGKTNNDVVPLRTYYQAYDGSIREIVHSGPPSANNQATDQVIVPAGVARCNTPIACESWGSFNAIDIYFIGNDYTGTHIRDHVWRSGKGWSEGPLTKLGWATAPGQQLLTAEATGASLDNSKTHLIFACGDNQLCQGWRVNNGNWAWQRHVKAMAEDEEL